MPIPFARGSFRLAYWLKRSYPSGTMTKLVAKCPIVSHGEEDELDKCKKDIHAQVCNFQQQLLIYNLSCSLM